MSHGIQPALLLQNHASNSTKLGREDHVASGGERSATESRPEHIVCCIQLKLTLRAVITWNTPVHSGDPLERPFKTSESGPICWDHSAVDRHFVAHTRCRFPHHVTGYKADGLAVDVCSLLEKKGRSRRTSREANGQGATKKMSTGCGGLESCKYIYGILVFHHRYQPLGGIHQIILLVQMVTQPSPA